MTSLDPVRYRKTLRSPDYDYSSPSAYFVTLCSRDREFLFEEAEAKRAVESAWHSLLDVFSGIELDEFVVMPNHVHGVIYILESGAYRLHPGTWKIPCRDEQLLVPTTKLVLTTNGDTIEHKIVTLGNIIGAFKTTAATRINKLHHQLGAIVWQKGYYEHIVRNDRELDRIREYIWQNPKQWKEDRDNPTNPMFGIPVKTSTDYLKDIT